jgi:hypothetical protein
MIIWSQIWKWNITNEEEKEIYPCDKYAPEKSQSVFRGITVSASSDVVFRWICQLKIAPYSYDWIDNGGRQSPRKLTPGIERLEKGQDFLIGKIVEFEEGGHITCVIPEIKFMISSIAMTYLVRSTGEKTSRVIVKIVVSDQNIIEKILGILLAIGDLIMMRKQLKTIKELAELAAK